MDPRASRTRSAAERPNLVEVGPAWPRRADAWIRRLRHALGHGFDGGALLDIAHVGSTAVPGFVAKPTIDLIARVHPWPLAPAAEARLVALGFVAHGERGIPGRAYYTRGGHALHLHVVGVESDHWARHVALRDFLRGDDAARERYAAAKATALASAGAGGRAAVQGDDRGARHAPPEGRRRPRAGSAVDDDGGCPMVARSPIGDRAGPSVALGGRPAGGRDPAAVGDTRDRRERYPTRCGPRPSQLAKL